jgi:Flp pilus assembly protein TadD
VRPQSAESLGELITQGRALNSQKNHTEALPAHERATMLDPSSAVAWNYKGSALTRLGCYSNAVMKRWQRMTRR